MLLFHYYCIFMADYYIINKGTNTKNVLVTINIIQQKVVKVNGETGNE